MIIAHFFNQVLPSGISLEFEWHQFFSGLQDSSGFSDRFQKWIVWCLQIHLVHFPSSWGPFQALHLQIVSLLPSYSMGFLFAGKFQVFVCLFFFFYSHFVVNRVVKNTLTGFLLLLLLKILRSGIRCIIIIIIIYSLEFFTSALADGLSLEIEWQQVSSNLMDSSQYSGQSQYCSSLDGPHSSANFQVLQSFQ